MTRLFASRQALAALVLSLAVLLILPCVSAQETTAGMTGTVKDSSGAVITKATVEVSSPALIGVKKMQTDEGGNYRFANLPPGDYTITVTAQGFKSYKQDGINLAVGRLPSIDIVLQVGAVGETVEVSGAAPMVDVTQSKVAVNIAEQVIEDLPKGRSFQSLIPFAPGARQEPLQSARGSRDTGFQIDGASDSENVYLIDGINTTNIQNGGVGKNFQMDFVQEVQIKSSSFEAEFGGAVGGVVNAVPKHGSNDWHGEVKTYIRNDRFNANDPCAAGASTTVAAGSTVCYVRANPATSIDSTNRLDQSAQFYIPKKDKRGIYEPGFELGGALLKDRLWIFTSYIPTLDQLHRTVNFTAKNAGPRTFTQSYTQHNAYSRIDYRPISTVTLFGAWNYAYSRTTGALPNPDSAYGQLNTGATTDPATIRADLGSVNPSSVYTFGGDWTPTSKLVVTARWGYMFSNNEDRGKNQGIRYAYVQQLQATDLGLDGVPIGSTYANAPPFATIGNNFQTLFDAYKRRSLNLDASYYLGHFMGSHNLKGGYFRMAQQNDVLSTYKTALVNLSYNSKYTPVTSTTACDAIIAQNVTNWGAAAGQCRGKVGFFTVSDGVDNSGMAKGNAEAIYFQDAWNVGHGLTLNLGIRFDKEFVPPYRAGFREMLFGWGDKIAPRIGGAYDLLHNGKVKIYATYGKFYDIMKLGLPRGSFGSDYWHDCVYAMDDPNFNLITPTSPGGHSCPDSGPAPGVTAGRFIENVDFRKTKDNPLDPPLDPNIKPMLQHEYVSGVDWAVAPNWSLETRYSRKRLDRTIEDMAITDDLGFYIGNPGSKFVDILHRPAILTGSTLSPALCPECPPLQGAIRRYDGMEIRLSRKTGQWWGSVSYAYSKLTGNYAGLTNSDITDGNGGRHAPNNNRAFDIPTMLYTPQGKFDDGPLATDRPHTAKIFGGYRLRWFHQETIIGLQQAAYQGTPLNTCLAVVGTSSACQYPEGRGNWVRAHRDPTTHDIVSDGVVQNARTSPYFQTDLNLKHEIKVSKTHENYRLTFETNILNVLNNHAVVGVYEFLVQTDGLVTASRTPRFPGDPGVDWNKLMVGYNYMDAVNGRGAFAGGDKLIMYGRYGTPQIWQLARNMRLALRFTF